MFERQADCRAFSRAWAKTGNRMAARMAMMAMTTSSSINVNPSRRRDAVMELLLLGGLVSTDDCPRRGRIPAFRLHVLGHLPLDRSVDFRYDGTIEAFRLECLNVAAMEEPNAFCNVTRWERARRPRPEPERRDDRPRTDPTDSAARGGAAW